MICWILQSDISRGTCPITRVQNVVIIEIDMKNLQILYENLPLQKSCSYSKFVLVQPSTWSPYMKNILLAYLY